MAGDLIKNDAERRRKIYAFGALVLIAIFMLIPQSTMLWIQSTQQHMVASEAGMQALAAISAPAQEITRSISGSLDLANLVHDPKPFIAHRATVALLGIYGVAWRVVYFGILLLVAAPLLAASFLDGLTRRKIAQWRYEYGSPVRHFVSRNTTVRLFDLLLLVLVLPIPVPPLAALVWLVLMGLAMRSWAANLQQRM